MTSWWRKRSLTLGSAWKRDGVAGAGGILGQSFALGWSAQRPPRLALFLFLRCECGEQLIGLNKARPVEPQGLHLALGRPLTGPQQQQQRGDHHAVNLNGNAGGRRSEERRVGKE